MTLLLFVTEQKEGRVSHFVHVFFSVRGEYREAIMQVGSCDAAIAFIFERSELEKRCGREVQVELISMTA